MIAAAEIERALTELNSDISFDAPIRRPSDYQFIFNPHTAKGMEDQKKDKGAIYYKGNFLCAMDRGLIPEFRIWSAREGVQEISMMDVLKYDDCKVAYMEIRPDHEHYNEALTKAERGDDNYCIAQNGKVFRYQALRFTQVPDRIVRIGWRNTLDNLIERQIPGITRRSLEDKLGVNLGRFGVTDSDQLVAESWGTN